MTDKQHLTSVMIVVGNESALRALRQAGIPQSVAQKLILSKTWRREQREAVAEKVKQIEKGQTK